MQHPMVKTNPHLFQMGSPNNQMGFLDSIKDWGQGLVDKYIDDPLRDLGKGVGLTDEEINRIASEANKEYQKELKNTQQNLLQQITGSGGNTSTTNSTITDLQNQITNLTSQLANKIPGGKTTLMVAGGAVGAFLLFKIIAGPKESQ